MRATDRRVVRLTCLVDSLDATQQIGPNRVTTRSRASPAQQQVPAPPNVPPLRQKATTRLSATGVGDIAISWS